MPLRELAPASPLKAPQRAAQCGMCLRLDAMAQEAYSDPEGRDDSKLTDVKILRGRHADSGECVDD